MAEINYRSAEMKEMLFFNALLNVLKVLFTEMKRKSCRKSIEFGNGIESK
jgi:hypothetical protein